MAEALRDELSRVQNNLHHLQRSNAELKEALQTDGPDPDFKLAIEENIVLIAKLRARAEALEKEIHKIEESTHGSAAEMMMSDEPAGREAAAAAASNSREADTHADEMQTDPEETRETGAWL